MRITSARDTAAVVAVGSGGATVSVAAGGGLSVAACVDVAVAVARGVAALGVAAGGVTVAGDAVIPGFLGVSVGKDAVAVAGLVERVIAR
jgi:hypothetical protein